MRAALLSFFVNIGLCLELKDIWSTQGLAVASTVAVIVQAAYLQRALTARRPELSFGPLMRDLAKIVAASAGMGTAVALGKWGLSSAGSGMAMDMLRLVLLIPVGAGVFAAIAFALKLEGRQELVDLVRRRLTGGSSESSDS
jgi:putative peptidoglycan lipid II flippase